MPMTAAVADPKRTPWNDRWRQPELEELLSGIKDPYQKLTREIVGRLQEHEALTDRMDWYGVSWKWSLSFRLVGDAGESDAVDAVCYVVPSEERPEVVVPLHRDVLAELPVRKLHRFLRDSIEVAKCAVDIHWVRLTPSSKDEAAAVLDLVDRKLEQLASDDPSDAG